MSAGDQLQQLFLSGGGFDHVNIAIIAVKAPTGDGFINVGAIGSTGLTGDLDVLKVGL